MVRRSQVHVGHDLTAQKEIMESTIESSGRCIIENGTIIFSQISARDGVVAGNIGTKGSKPSTLNIGIDQHTNRNIKYTKNKVELQKKEQEQLPDEIEHLEEMLQTMETEKNNLTKTLSVHLERIDSLEKQLKVPGVKNQGVNRRKMEKIVTNLKSEKERMENHLQSLSNDIEKLSKRASQKHDDIKNGQVELKVMEEKLEDLIADKATHGQGAVVEARGKVYTGTTVAGPHASLTISDDVAGLTIKEVRQVDEHGNESMVMKMKSLN